VAMTTDGWIQCKTFSDAELDILIGGDTSKANMDNSVLHDWRKLAWVPSNWFPNYESGIAVHSKGSIAYISEFSNHLLQIIFQW